ncbi:MAG: hypothetical protein JET69_06120 [Methanomassiliicoccales archaeon]|nr:hypothetical protein [Methanomassiliicoccales archaeon]
MNTAFVIGSQKISSPLDSCDHMGMTNTPVQYIDGEPSLYCNITFSDIDVYADGRIGSTYDLTLSHHITVGLNQTDVKVEAIFDLGDARLIDTSTNSELAQGGTFSVELPYAMMLTLPNSHGEPIVPTGHSDNSLEYNQTDANGNPLQVSQLKMNNEFLIFNGTGSYGSTGYSSMQYSAQSMVTHGFPGLVYGDTRSIKSDPEITVYYDSITNNDFLSVPGILIYAVIGIVAVTIVATALVIRKRNHRRNGEQ